MRKPQHNKVATPPIEGIVQVSITDEKKLIQGWAKSLGYDPESRWWEGDQDFYAYLKEQDGIEVARFTTTQGDPDREAKYWYLVWEKDKGLLTIVEEDRIIELDWNTSTGDPPKKGEVIENMFNEKYKVLESGEDWVKLERLVSPKVEAE